MCSYPHTLLYIINLITVSLSPPPQKKKKGGLKEEEFLAHQKISINHEELVLNYFGNLQSFTQ